ncbi:MAG: amino acid deaminase/aldolase [Bacteriovoracia bacterium]
MDHAQWSAALGSEPLPCMAVDLDAFDRNVAAVAKFLQPHDAGPDPIAAMPVKTIRVATKSLRVPELIKRVLRHGSPYWGLMCYSTAEAAFLAQQELDDFLIAYPTVQASDLEVLKRLHFGGKLVRIVVDCIEHLRVIDQAMSGCPHPFPVVIEVDAALPVFDRRLGVRRSPVRTTTDLVALIRAAKVFSNVQVDGLMVYEAQVAGLPDRNPFRPWLNPIHELVRRFSMRRLWKFRQELSSAFVAEGLALEIFNGGGTGSLNYAAQEPWLTELTAGSAFFSPHLFDYYSNVRFEPAACFALQASRISDPGYVTCLGGGYVASGSPGWDRVPKPYIPAGAKLLGDEGGGEVQTPVKLPPLAPVKLGDFVLFRHAKAGELAERFNECLLVQGGKIVERVRTYRGHGECYF